MSSRAVLCIGFGGLLALMIGIAFSATRTLARIERSNVEIRQEFLARDDLLDHLRADLYRASLDVRDYLLNTDPRLAEQRRSEVLTTEAEMASLIERYRRNLSPDESAALDELARDVNLYAAAVAPVLRWDAATRQQRGSAFIGGQMLPRHQQLIQLADRIGQMDAHQLSIGESNVAHVFAGFRREAIVTAVLIVSFGLGVALLSIRRVEVLEHELQSRYLEVRRLSARVVAAQEDERRRLSRELHDEVGASMSALLMELGNLDAVLPPDPALHERVQAVRRLAESNVGVVRNMALLLRPAMLDDLGLIPALQWQAREVARRTGMKVRVDAGGISESLPDEHRTAVYRVVQEALHNATRHSRATHVTVVVRQEAAHIRVRIEDDGAGFHPGHAKGAGILGMEERVKGLGGSFHIDSKPGRGTAVSIVLPYES